MSQAMLAQLAYTTTNYISRLECREERGEGGAPGIDLVARFAEALQVPIAELLPWQQPDELTVIRTRAKQIFDSLIETNDKALLTLLIQCLARLADAKH